MAEKESASRKGDCTEVHKCSECKKAFWAKASWDRDGVICPHCKHEN